MIRIRILPDNRKIEIKAESNVTLRKIISMIDLDLDDILVVVNGKVIEDPDYVIDKDAEIKLVRVGSGG